MNNDLRILIVEDDTDGSGFLSVLLQFEGYTIATARSLAKALELSQADHFDLYILDSRLPDGSGVDLCKQLRANDIGSPIVFYSGVSSQSGREAALKSGAQDYIVKPADPGQLEEVVARLISNGDGSPG